MVGAGSWQVEWEDRYPAKGAETQPLKGYRDTGIDLPIYRDPRNDAESREVFVSDVMPHFA